MYTRYRFVHLDVDIKEHTFGKCKLLTFSAWRNSINAAIGGVGILINLRAYNAIKSIDMISNRIVAIHFMGNPLTTVISCYSPTNVSDQEETERFYVDLTSYTRHIPKHNVLVIGGDFNAHLGKENGYIYSFHINTNRNGNMLKNFIHENNLLCLNTHFQKRSGQLWTRVCTYLSK